MVELLMTKTVSIYRGFNENSDGLGGFLRYPKWLKNVKAKIDQRDRRETFQNQALDVECTHVIYTKEKLKVDDVIKFDDVEFNVLAVEEFDDVLVGKNSHFKALCKEQLK